MFNNMKAKIPKLHKRKLAKLEQIANGRRHKHIKCDTNISVSENILELVSKSGNVCGGIFPYC